MGTTRRVLEELCDQLQWSLNENASVYCLPINNVVSLSYVATPLNIYDHGGLIKYIQHTCTLDMFINKSKIASCTYLQKHSEDLKVIETLLYRRVLRTVFFNGAISIHQQSFKNFLLKEHEYKHSS